MSHYSLKTRFTGAKLLSIDETGGINKLASKNSISIAKNQFSRQFSSFTLNDLPKLTLPTTTVIIAQYPIKFIFRYHSWMIFVLQIKLENILTKNKKFPIIFVKCIYCNQPKCPSALLRYIISLGTRPNAKRLRKIKESESSSQSSKSMAAPWVIGMFNSHFNLLSNHSMLLLLNGSSWHTPRFSIDVSFFKYI